MPNRNASPLVSTTPLPKSSSCPHVADLIDFALGQAASDQEQQLRQHLLAENCSSCRSWVEQAAQHRGRPPIDWSKMTVASFTSLSSSPPTSDPTPVPENAKWQRQAFRDLEKRLGLVEE